MLCSRISAAQITQEVSEHDASTLVFRPKNGTYLATVKCHKLNPPTGVDKEMDGD